jgi:hypothetical protein
MNWAFIYNFLPKYYFSDSREFASVKKLWGFSLPVNYADWMASACRRS